MTAIVIGSQQLLVPVIFFYIPSVYRYFYEHRPLNNYLPWEVNFIFLFFGAEFLYYWYHRIAHSCRLIWLSHNVHHQPNQITLPVAIQLADILDNLVGLWLMWIPLVFLGFQVNDVMLFNIIRALYQLPLHTTILPRIKFLERYLITPSLHCLHHASNPEYINKNFGGIIVLYDKIFKTFKEEDPTIEIRYGLVHPINSFNPVYITFIEAFSLIRDTVKAKNLKLALKYIINAPGWRP